MNDSYLLEQHVKKGRALRKAQKENRAYKGDPTKDPIKKAYLDEQYRRETDYDRLLVETEKIHPVPEES